MSFFLSDRVARLAVSAVVAVPIALAVFYRKSSTMAPKLSAIRSSNAALVSDIKGAPVAVFVGGTSGIGQGMAETFAHLRNGRAHIVIVGRNEAAANEIIFSFPKPPTTTTDATEQSWTHEFVQCDATLMKNVQSASQAILAKHPKINYLVMSPGYMTTSGRDETAEGIDKKLAVHYYARWKFIDGLLPALRKAKEDGEDARVLSVLGAGYGGEIDVNDLGLKKGYSIQAAALQGPTYNDLMMEEFGERNPGITFAQSNPGLVLTNIMTSSPTTWMRMTAPVLNVMMRPFGRTPAQCAQYMWSGLLASSEGAVRLGADGQNLGKKRYHGSEEQRQRLWEHSVQATTV